MAINGICYWKRNEAENLLLYRTLIRHRSLTWKIPLQWKSSTHIHNLYMPVHLSKLWILYLWNQLNTSYALYTTTITKYTAPFPFLMVAAKNLWRYYREGKKNTRTREFCRLFESAKLGVLNPPWLPTYLTMVNHFLRMRSDVIFPPLSPYWCNLLMYRVHAWHPQDGVLDLRVHTPSFRSSYWQTSSFSKSG